MPKKGNKQKSEESQEFEYDSYQDSDSIAKYLQELLEGFREGHIYFEQEGETIDLSPRGLLRFQVRAQQKKHKQSLRLKISWKTESEVDISESELKIETKPEA